jgi:thiosulfate dehydrogenase
MDKYQKSDYLLALVNRLLLIIGLLIIAILILTWHILKPLPGFELKIDSKPKSVLNTSARLAELKLNEEISSFWTAADINEMTDSIKKQQLVYGKELIAHTADYFGPSGSITHATNGMNCQNCHLDAGTRPWGNNYGAVFSTYPKYRARSGQVEDIYKRINDCFERSLNGKALAEQGKEMQAIKAYIEYVGKNVPKGEKGKASGIYELTFMNRAADPEKGKQVYISKCQSCHQPEGQGILADGGKQYTYPPLWGPHSYNIGAGLYRLSRLAGYVKYNMPLGSTYTNAQLSDEECWDVAAYVNSQPRPLKNLKGDWPLIAEKPIDHPFGPFADTFSETQHKLGPFQPIADMKKEAKNKIKSGINSPSKS